MSYQSSGVRDFDFNSKDVDFLMTLLYHLCPVPLFLNEISKEKNLRLCHFPDSSYKIETVEVFVTV